MVEEINVFRDGLRIYGKIQFPDGMGPFPAAIFSHGFGASRVYDGAMGDEFVERGIAFVAFDFCGGGPASQSDGTMLDMSVLTESEDLQAVLGAVRLHDRVDPNRIFLIGSSQGGYVSALVAGGCPDAVRALVLNFPAFCIGDDARSLIARLSIGGEVPEQARIGGLSVGQRYLQDAVETDIFRAIAGYRGDVLIIHGAGDEVVPLEHSLRAIEVYGDAAELVVFGGMGHGFRNALPKHYRRSVELTLEFIIRHL